MPIVALACSEASSRRDSSIFKATTVLEGATRNPSTRLASQESPRAKPAPRPRAALRRIWSVPLPRISRRDSITWRKENWTPIPNMRRMTPMSARRSTSSRLAAGPGECGPITSPAARKPMIVGRRR